MKIRKFQIATYKTSWKKGLFVSVALDAAHKCGRI